MVSLTPKIEYVKSFLNRLRSVAYRIRYKIAVQYGHLLYIYNLCIFFRRNLRSSTNSVVTFLAPRVNQKTLGSRVFSTAAPQIWNEIPSSIRTIVSNNVFRKTETDYFECAFYDLIHVQRFSMDSKALKKIIYNRFSAVFVFCFGFCFGVALISYIVVILICDCM